jgi:hypothetical protein
MGCDAAPVCDLTLGCAERVGAWGHRNGKEGRHQQVVSPNRAPTTEPVLPSPMVVLTGRCCRHC